MIAARRIFFNGHNYDVTTREILGLKLAAAVDDAYIFNVRDHRDALAIRT
jgi:hypothetical protein